MSQDSIVRLAEASILRGMIDNLICRAMQRPNQESERDWILFLNDERSTVLRWQDKFYKETQNASPV